MRITINRILIALLAVAATVAGCSLFESSKVVIPTKVVKALDLPPDADGPYKGQVARTPEQAQVIRDEYDAKLIADEAKAKAERDRKVQAAKDAADAAVAAATTQVARTKKMQARALQQVLDAQADELDAIAESASNSLITQLNAQKLAATKAEEALAAIAADREAAGRAFTAAIADRNAREESRLGVLNGAKEVGTQVFASVGGPWGGLGLTALGVVGGWLGLSKPGDKAAVAKASSLSGTLQTLVKAIDVLPSDVQQEVKKAVSSISTPSDEIHITEAKAVLKT